ncbi:FxLD family lantipeptide [Streptomyces ambofaciens]|uniref:FxLD family lanthipeptide n=1 Tax=Streptomyces TaxID=1883 RepID=UPI00131EEF3C|nr:MULTISPECIES: FxLD family lanthipeptide [Streptomyces]MBU6531820.1 FxLD family lantipeptide [Streptomyces sp. A108]
MTPRVTDQRVRTVSASAAQDPFDLNISVIESGGTVASDGGCGSTCGNACISSGS